MFFPPGLRAVELDLASIGCSSTYAHSGQDKTVDDVPRAQNQGKRYNIT
jgi:hypothetical protein